jgi:hypothetical protein
MAKNLLEPIPALTGAPAWPPGMLQSRRKTRASNITLILFKVNIARNGTKGHEPDHIATLPAYTGLFFCRASTQTLTAATFVRRKELGGAPNTRSTHLKTICDTFLGIDKYGISGMLLSSTSDRFPF